MSAQASQAGASVSGGLRHIVAVNEQIKSVIAMAFTVQAMSLNAILLSRRAGDVARGFGVLSGELRRFALELSASMVDLRVLTGRSVATVTSLVKQARMASILHRIDVGSGPAATAVNEVRCRHDRLVEGQARVLADVRRQLGLRLEALASAVMFGSVLARSARIEGAYGGAFAPQLTQVSDEFARTITAIGQALDGLRKAQ